MAILKQGNNQYEVRIKHYPDETYYDEYIKVEEREKPGADTCLRFIAVQENEQFTIEITLHKGFDFGEDELVQLHFELPPSRDALAWIEIPKPKGTTILASSITKELQYADIKIEGRKMLKTRFAFRGLEVGHSLEKETDVMGISPSELGSFRLYISKFRWITKTLTDDEMLKAAEEEHLAKEIDSSNPPERAWDAKKVDEDSFVKDGVAQAVGFIGGQLAPKKKKKYPWNRTSPLSPVPVSRTKRVTSYVESFDFFYHYRSEEYLERVGIVKYPPPLYLYTWDELEVGEQKEALKDLQAINKIHVQEALEAKNGESKPRTGRDRQKNEPKEWRGWTKMYVWERKLAFETLKKAKRDYERGETQKQYESISGEIISLIDDDPIKALQPSIEEDDAGDVDLAASRTIKSEPKDSDNQLTRTTKRTKTRKESVIKDESSSDNERPTKKHRSKHQESESDEEGFVDIRPAKKSRTHKSRRTSFSEDDESVDAELEKKKAKAQKLAEAIETEKRLAKLQEEQRTLEEEIENEQRKKKSHRKGRKSQYVELD